MTAPNSFDNPFPGLRPFGPDETHLFFGREPVIDQLLMRLRETRFLCVMGSSGCGKSSLVGAGLVPSLHSGLMTTVGSNWRVAIMRPGTDPFGNLAAALNEPDVLGEQSGIEETSPVLTEVTLRRSNRGLVECTRLSRLPADDNLLVVVDQFEELFRFKRSGQSESAREEAIAFVKRLLAAIEQKDVPIYVVLTLRSEYVGECNEYPGLPEAVNIGQYLVPRMTREQLRSAIGGPILVAGAELAPRLLVRLLNDVGDNPDRLPMLQHALLRTWNYWHASGQSDVPIDIDDYEHVGTMQHALSKHANEAYEELESDRYKGIATKVFKALTDISSDSRGVRRPTSVEQLCLLADASIDEIATVIDVFRQPERSFLVPPLPVPLTLETVVDISHESLMRVWDQLIDWTREENDSARTYVRLASAATRYEEGVTGLWRDPELEIALKWRDKTQPSEAWAGRYDPAFRRAIAFLDDSKLERDRLEAERQRAHRKKLQAAWGISVVLLVFAVFAWLQQQRAETQQLRAEQNYQLAVQAVDEMLTDVAVEESLADVPQTEQLRQQLLEKARLFFETLEQDEAAGAELRLRNASAQLRLGKIYGLQGHQEKASAAYRAAIEQINQLHNEFPEQPLFQLQLSRAYDDFGDQLEPYDNVAAEAAIASALEMQLELVARYPDVAEYKYELGRTYNNRGILLGKQVNRIDMAEASYRNAITAFESLFELRGGPLYKLRLARTKNNLAILLRDSSRISEAVAVYNDAIALMEELVETQPEKREYRNGLASMYNNLSNLHLRQSNTELALAANSEARQLFDELASPVPGLRDEIANNHNTRGGILSSSGRPSEAIQAYETALQQYEQLEADLGNFDNDPDLSQRYANTLANLAILDAAESRFDSAIERISNAIAYNETAVRSSAASTSHTRSLANTYWLLADTHLRSGNYVDAVDAAESAANVIAESDIIYRSALLYERATILVASDRTLGVSAREDFEEAYKKRTVELLAAAIANGYPVAQLQEDIASRFVHLQDRDDFRRLFIERRED